MYLIDVKLTCSSPIVGPFELFAQHFVLALYDKLMTTMGGEERGIRATTRHFYMIEHKHQVIMDHFGDHLVPGGECSRNIYNEVNISE